MSFLVPNDERSSRAAPPMIITVACCTKSFSSLQITLAALDRPRSGQRGRGRSDGPSCHASSNWRATLRGRAVRSFDGVAANSSAQVVVSDSHYLTDPQRTDGVRSSESPSLSTYPIWAKSLEITESGPEMHCAPRHFRAFARLIMPPPLT